MATLQFVFRSLNGVCRMVKRMMEWCQWKSIQNPTHTNQAPAWHKYFYNMRIFSYTTYARYHAPYNLYLYYERWERPQFAMANLLYKPANLFSIISFHTNVCSLQIIPRKLNSTLYSYFNAVINLFSRSNEKSSLIEYNFIAAAVIGYIDLLILAVIGINFIWRFVIN